MLLTTDIFTFVLLLLSFFATTFGSIFIYKKLPKSQLRDSFLFTISCLSICCIGLIAQVLFSDACGIDPIYFDYFVYIGTCFLPITVFFTGLVFANTKITFKKKHLLLFIIPIIRHSSPLKDT